MDKNNTDAEEEEDFRKQLIDTQQVLKEREGQIEKCLHNIRELEQRVANLSSGQNNIEELQHQNEKLSQELHIYRNAAQHHQDSDSQVGVSIAGQVPETSCNCQGEIQQLRQYVEKLNSELYVYHNAAQHRKDAGCQAGEDRMLERQLEKSHRYNEDLRQQIERLSSELHSYRSAAQHRSEAECQVGETDIEEAYGDKPFPVWDIPDESAQTTEGNTENGTSIADSLAAAAQKVMWEQAGYVYDSASGLYYDSSTGYYYDPASGLTYDPNTQAYYYYDQTEEQYKFHSYAYSQQSEQNNATTSDQTENVHKHSDSGGGPHKKRHSERRKNQGTCLGRQEESVDRLTSDLQKLAIQNIRRHALESSVNVLPCIRVIVQASDTVAVGTFFLVTCSGGTIGRDKDPKHAIQIPDVNISKVHAEVKYDSDNSCYTVEDMGSQNGTFVNDLRISESKEKSAAVPLSHGDTLRVASTQMLLHIHPGTDTCDQCEPGQVMAALQAQQTVFNDHVVLTSQERKKLAQQELKAIKKKYGLANCAYVDNMTAVKNPNYADKAGLRRRYIGSEHPSHAERHEAPASVHRPISSENKGHRMLAKMGWKEGSGLGKQKSGIVEPVTVEVRANQAAGLGSTYSAGVSLDNVHAANKVQRLLKTKERYNSTDKNVCSQSNTNEDATS